MARPIRGAIIAVLLAGPVAPLAIAQESAPPAPSAVVAAEQPAPAQPPAQPAVPAAIPAPKDHDLTPIGMFLHADPVVQGVMVLLLLASMASWVVLLVKGLGLWVAKRRLRGALAVIRPADSLTEASLLIRKGAAAHLLLEAEEELAASEGLSGEGIKERTALGLQRIEAAIAKRMAVGTGILATTGSTGPFIGLFGTVWGIMHSFVGIVNSNTTNLAVVVPGIAEALLATGIGLVAAIPAVVIYNVLTRAIGGYRILIGDVAAMVMRHLSRDIDRRACEIGGSGATLRAAAE